MQNYGIKARYPYNEINVKEIYNKKTIPFRVQYQINYIYLHPKGRVFKI